MNLGWLTWCICCSALCVLTSESSGQRTNVVRNNLQAFPDQSSLQSSASHFTTEETISQVSTMNKIYLIRYYLAAKIPGQKIAVVLDTAPKFYDNVKRLWKLVTNGEVVHSDIMIFVYNDTDCSLLTTTNKTNGSVSEELNKISTSSSTSADVAEGIFECVDLAQNMVHSDSSVMLLTGRKAGDASIFGKRTANEMTKKRIEFNSVWCADEVGTLEETNDYREMTKNTNGHFVEFTEIDQKSIIEDGEVGHRPENGKGNSTESSNYSLEAERIFTGLETSRDETADLLYDPKTVSFDGNEGNSRMINGDVEDERKEPMEFRDRESAPLTVNESVARLETTAVEVTAATSLVGRPGGVSRLTFTVTNNYPVTIRHYFQARSTLFTINYLEPRNAWIESGQSINVVADVSIPTTATSSSTGTVTLVIQGIGTVEKSAYVYVRDTGSTIYDTAKPTINYSFNNNCAGKLGSDTCSDSIWTVDVTVQDSDSGLQRVSSTPKGLQATTTFISGSKSSTKFQYAGTCCQTSVVITAEDLLGNSKSETIEVTVWWNLSGGEIAAIVLGTLLLLLIIVVIILIVIFCIRKRRKSQDLPYTQRYGARPPAARAERTSF